MRLASRELDIPQSRHNPAVANLFTRNLSSRLEALVREGSATFSVERTATAALLAAPGETSQSWLLERVCAELEVSRWTLHRRLGLEGTTLTALWARVRLREACRLLSDTGLPIGEVRARLGFRSKSSFTRFFERGTGVSPARYRLAGVDRYLRVK